MTKLKNKELTPYIKLYYVTSINGQLQLLRQPVIKLARKVFNTLTFTAMLTI